MMRNIKDAYDKNELYIWVDYDGMANIPGLGRTSRGSEMLPEEIKEIKESYWNYFFSEDVHSMIVTYQGVYGMLFQWDFFMKRLEQYGLSSDKAKKIVYAIAIDMDNGKWYGEVFIGIGTLPDGGHQLYWFAPWTRLPIRSYEYPMPRRVFENILSFGDEIDLDSVIERYEEKTEFDLKE